MVGRRCLPAAMAYRAGTALCPAVLHVRIYGYRFQPSLGYVSLVVLCVDAFRSRLCLCWRWCSFNFSCTVWLRQLGSTKDDLRSSNRYFRGGLLSPSVGHYRIRCEAVDGLFLQRCMCLATGLSASTPRPMSVDNQRRAHLILFIPQRLPCTLRFSVLPFVNLRAPFALSD